MDNNIESKPNLVTITLTEEDLAEMDRREADPAFHALCSSKEHRHAYRTRDGRTIFLCRPTDAQAAEDDALQYSWAVSQGKLTEEDLPNAVGAFMRAGWFIAEDLPVANLDELSDRLHRADERGLPPDPWSDRYSEDSFTNEGIFSQLQPVG